MKQYLKNIHTKSPAHKKRFALLVSGGTTLLIFSIWSMVVFGGSGAKVADVPEAKVENTNTASPFGDIKSGVANSFEAVKEQVKEIGDTLNSTNFESEYQQVRDEALTN